MSTGTGESSNLTHTTTTTTASSSSYHKVEMAVMIHPAPLNLFPTVPSPRPPPPSPTPAAVQALRAPPVREAVGDGGMRRIRLSTQQKRMVRAYAHSVGWRVLKEDQERLTQFCTEIGITTRMCRNWINRNRRKPPSTELTL